MTREQQRAQKAYAKVKAMSSSPDLKFSKDYGRLCRRLPTLILHTGLCQALAFLQAKSGLDMTTPHSRLLLDLAEIVTGTANGESFAKQAREGVLTEYRRLTLESLQCAQYLKRYAEAFELGEAPTVTGLLAPGAPAQ